MQGDTFYVEAKLLFFMCDAIQFFSIEMSGRRCWLLRRLWMYGRDSGHGRFAGKNRARGLPLAGAILLCYRPFMN